VEDGYLYRWLVSLRRGRSSPEMKVFYSPAIHSVFPFLDSFPSPGCGPRPRVFEQGHDGSLVRHSATQVYFYLSIFYLSASTATRRTTAPSHDELASGKNIFTAPAATGRRRVS